MVRCIIKAVRIDLFNGDSTEAGSFTDPNQGNFRYDANGNTTHTPRHEELAYTDDSQVRYVNLGGGGQRHADQRVVRLVQKNGVKALTLYLAPLECHLRKAVSGYTKLVLQVLGHGRHAPVLAPFRPPEVKPCADERQRRLAEPGRILCVWTTVTGGMRAIGIGSSGWSRMMIPICA